MKKFLISSFMFILTSIVFIPFINAGSCTNVMDGPSLEAGTTYNGSFYSLASSYATATGNNAKTYFYNLETLSNTFISWNNRVVTISLMEADGAFNPSDEVKIYKGSFNGLTMTSISLNQTKIAGDIEGNGDHISELYIKTYFTKHANDPSSATRSFFDYQLCQD